jgi:hypothetical protein
MSEIIIEILLAGDEKAAVALAECAGGGDEAGVAHLGHGDRCE